MTDLLDLLREQEHAVDPRRDWVHACMPNMAYACGGNIVDGLPDGGPRGVMHLGGWGEKDWPKITCPGCRADGRRVLAQRAHIQQSPAGHECLPLDHVDVDERCARWQSIPEEA